MLAHLFTTQSIVYVLVGLFATIAILVVFLLLSLIDFLVRIIIRTFRNVRRFRGYR